MQNSYKQKQLHHFWCAKFFFIIILQAITSIHQQELERGLSTNHNCPDECFVREKP
jgi:hypothetical protein